MEKTTTNCSQYVDNESYVLIQSKLFLDTSPFWLDVNKKVDNQIDFSTLEDCFKVANESNNTDSDNTGTIPTKSKPTTVC